jgi:serine protease AprX
MKRTISSVLALSAAIILFTGTLQAGPKVAVDLKKLNDQDVKDFLVQFSSAPDTNSLNAVLGGSGQLRKALRGSTYVIRLSAKQAKALDKDSRVKYVTPDRKVSGTLDYATPAVYADIAQSYNYKGTNVGVAVIDSGVYDHPELKDSACVGGRVVYKQSFVENDTSTADLYGHGTHVAGIIAGNGKCADVYWRTRQFIGVAPEAKIISLRVLNASGAGTDSGVIAAIDRAIELKSQYNIRVMNLSLGRGVFESCALDPLCQAVERAWKAGIVVVASAGNGGRNNTNNTNGYGTISSPGISPYVITVGAMRDKSTTYRSDDVLASYSSKGPTAFDHYVKPDLVAPGNRIVSYQAPGSTFVLANPDNVPARNYYSYTSSTLPSAYYLQMSGTSMAAPMVAGAAALLIQKDSTLTPDAVKARLMKSATKDFQPSTVYVGWNGAVYYIQNDIFSVGAGYLNVWGALNNTDIVPSTRRALSPKASLGSSGVSITHDSISVWKDSVMWGDSLVWGDRVFLSGSSILWGDSVCWGDSTSTGYSILWGDSIMWGDSLMWGDSVVWGDSTTAREGDQ